MKFAWCCSTLIFVALFSRALCGGEKTGSAVEGTQQHTQSELVPQCSVCWSMESAAHCQHEATPKMCTDEQLNATVARLHLINPAPPSAEKGPDGRANEEQRHYRCYTLAAVAGTGDSRKTFYGKGCTTSDPCAGWAKEQGDCALCSGSNCNVAAPVEQGRGGGGKVASSVMAKSNHTTSAGTPGILCNSWAVLPVATGALSWVRWATGP